MISFRYHIVSIIAVFLALALGVAMGTTVVKQSVVDSLRAQTQRALNNTRDLEDQVKQQDSQLAAWNTFGKEVTAWVVSGRLTGNEIVVITEQGVDASQIDGVSNVLADPTVGAGAKIMAVLEVTPRMALTGQSDRAILAQDLGTPVRTAAPDLQKQATAALADRLATGPPPLPSSDLLARLIEQRFLTIGPGSASPSDVSGVGQSLVMLSGGSKEPAVAPEDFLVPLAASLVQDHVYPVAAAETAQTTYPFVSLLRQDSSVNGKLVTVDDVDTAPGRMAIVLGLHELLLDPGKGGNYGIKAGASAIIPAVPPPQP